MLRRFFVNDSFGKFFQTADEVVRETAVIFKGLCESRKALRPSSFVVSTVYYFYF